MSDKLTYQQAGVDPEKAASLLANFGSFLKSRPKDPALLAGIGPFASCYSMKELLRGCDDPILVTSCDGVGTKVKLALDWGKLDGLGQDLVAMNVNDLLCVGARPFLFLDYYACGRLREAPFLTILQSIQQACEMAGCSLAGGETAEMPGMYHGEDFDLAGFTIGIADRAALLGPEKVRAGDVLLALPSSGFHSNGFSLVRRLLERERIGADDPAPGGGTWRDAALAPTRIYVKPLLPLVPEVHALAHITGGGLFENLPRVLPKGTVGRVDSTRWELPPLFAWAKEKAGISMTELLSTLNAGVGMIAVVAPSQAAGVREALAKEGIAAKEIGHVENGKADEPARVVWA